MSTSIRAVLFDLGGVWVKLRPWIDACKVAGASNEETQKLKTFEEHDTIIHAHLNYELGRISTRSFMHLVAEALQVDAVMVSKVFCARIEGPHAGTDALLDALAKTKVTTGCLSNTNDLHWSHMLGVLGDDVPARIPLERLHQRFASQSMGLAKPHAPIYQATQRLLQLRGDEIVFFDDRADNIAGAKACGWHAHQIVENEKTPAEQMTAHLILLGVLS